MVQLIDLQYAAAVNFGYFNEFLKNFKKKTVLFC